MQKSRWTPAPKDAISGPRAEENLALIQTIVGNNTGAISTLAQLLQTPYNSWLYIPAPITPAFLRLDPFWDPLRADPAFQKLCEEKQEHDRTHPPTPRLRRGRRMDTNGHQFLGKTRRPQIERITRMSGEHMRLACWVRRLAETELLQPKTMSIL